MCWLCSIGMIPPFFGGLIEGDLRARPSAGFVFRVGFFALNKVGILIALRISQRSGAGWAENNEMLLSPWLCSAGVI